MAERLVEVRRLPRGGIPAGLSRRMLGLTLVFLVVIVPLAFLVSLSLLEPEEDPDLLGGPASWSSAALRRAEQEVRERERLHYALHLALGRAFSLCPCTHDVAASQYRKAQSHAHTPGQRALVTHERPRSARAAARDALRLAAGGFKWVGERILARIERR